MDDGEARKTLVSLGEDYDLHEDRHVKGEDPAPAERGEPWPLTFYSSGNSLWRVLWDRGSNGSRIEVRGRRTSWLIE